MKAHLLRRRLTLLVLALLLLAVVTVGSALADEPPAAPGDAIGLQESVEEIKAASAEEENGEAQGIIRDLTDSSAAEGVPLEGLGRNEAGELLEGVFGQQVETAAGVFDDLHVEKFLADNVAVIPAGQQPIGTVEEERGGGQYQGATLLNSTIPLRIEGRSGQYEALNLELNNFHGELEPSNPLVDVGIPNELGEGISLGDGGIQIMLSGAPGDRAPSDASDVAFYPNVAPDSDLAVAPTATGVETFSQLRSPDAPRSLTFHLSLPAGATLSSAPDGGAEVKDGEDLLVGIPAPIANDATGAEVPVSLDVAGDAITLTVHPDQSATYPILADPLFQSYEWLAKETSGGIDSDKEAFWESAPHEEWSPEVVRSAGSGSMGLWHQFMGAGPPIQPAIKHLSPGLYVWGFEGRQPAKTGDHSSWVYTVPRYYTDQQKYGVAPSSFITHMTLTNLFFQGFSGYYSPAMVAGLWDSNNGWVSVVSHEGLEEHWLNNLTYPYEFNNGTGNVNVKKGSVGEWALENIPKGEAQLFVGAASVEIGEPESEKPAFGVPSPSGPSKWVNGTPSPFEFTASEAGLGVYSLNLSEEQSAAPHSWKTLYGCTGVGGSACPHTWASSEAGTPALKYEPSSLPQGIDTLKLAAEDPLGHVSAVSHPQVKVDHTAPALNLSGAITEQGTLGTSAAQYALKYNVTDGDSATGAALGTIGTAGTGEGKLEVPVGVALDASRNMYVVDRTNSRVEKFNSAGTFLSQFGNSGKGMLSGPSDITVDSEKYVWAADTNNNRLVRFNDKGEFVAMYGKSVNKTQTEAAGPESARNVCTASSGNTCQAGVAGSANGEFNQPRGIAVTAGGNLMIADTGNNRVQKISPSGEYLAKIGSLGSGPAQLNAPYDLAVAPDGSIWVADTGNNRIQKWTGTFEYLLQTGSLGEADGQLKSPGGITIAPSGHAIVSDSSGNRVEVFQSNGAYLKKFGATGSGTAQFSEPRGLAVDSDGSIVVTDAKNHRLTRWSHADYDPQAGVTKVEVKVDSEAPKVLYNSACGAGKDCSRVGEWTYMANEYATGAHTVVVTVTDGVNLTTSKTLTVNSIKDTTAPQLIASAALFTAPEGWVEQKSYSYSASAKDPGGRGTTSLVLKVDGSVVGSSTGACPSGGCERSLSGTLNVASYSGGAHPAEIIATDGGGLTTKKAWTINVDPKGNISTAEVEDTLKAADETSSSEIVAPNAAIIPLKEREGGNDPSLKAGTGLLLESSGTPDLSDISKAPTDGFSVGVPDSTIHAEPVTTAAGATSAAVIESSVAVEANTHGSADTLVRPVYNGVMSYESIRDTAGPETFSWEVILREGQTLKANGTMDAEILYGDGSPAMLISAEPAHDAVGTSVPTSLTVSEGHIVTLKVAHHSASFVYPVVAGAGWQGGYTTEYVAAPKDEKELAEERAKKEAEEIAQQEREKQAKWEQESKEFEEGKGPWTVLAPAGHGHYGPPIPFPGGETDDQGASASSAISRGNTMPYYWDLCTYEGPGGCIAWDLQLSGQFDYNGNFVWWKPTKPHPHCTWNAHGANVQLTYCEWSGKNHQPYKAGYHISSQAIFHVSPGGAPAEIEEPITEYMYGDGYAEGHRTTALCNPLSTC